MSLRIAVIQTQIGIQNEKCALIVNGFLFNAESFNYLEEEVAFISIS